ncbi:MAG: transcriptional regulator TbsP [Haloarculaceae archaeon]
MSENVHADGIVALLDAELSAAGERLDAINPSRATIEELVAVMSEREETPRVRLLAAERPLKDVLDDFLVASRAANLVAADRLALRTIADPPENSLLVTDDEVVAVVTAGDRVAGLTTDDEAFVADARERYGGVWEEAEPFQLRTPPLAEVRETLSADISDATAADFDSVLASLQTARGNGDGLDEVTISLLVAARNGELLYDISKWGEDVGLASKATFSRTKTKLEDMGLIDTEKVPIDVGRPRLRLQLGDDRLQDADPDQLANVAQSLLAS